MNRTDFDLRDPLKPGDLMDAVRKTMRAVRALMPISTPSVTAEVQLEGTRYTAKGGGASGAELVALTTVREGLDAVECVDGAGATVYCLKPPGMRCDGRTAYAVAGMAYGLDNGTTPNWMAYKLKVALEQYGSHAGAFRAIRRVKTANSGTYGDDSTDIGAVFYHLAPFYTDIASGGSVTGTDLIAAVASAVKLNASDLSINSGGDVDATCVDLTPRAWEPMDIFVNNVQLIGRDAYGREKVAFDATGGSVFPP